jgi:hypothetical protein
VTAFAATYLAFVALRHSAKPRIIVVWHRGSPLPLSAGRDNHLIFDVINIGHWYASPPARDIVVEFRCSSVFRDARLLRGGVGGSQEAQDAGHSCPGPELILRSLPFTLFAEERAKFAVVVDWLGRMAGNGTIAVRAYSADGATFWRDFGFEFEQ